MEKRSGFILLDEGGKPSEWAEKPSYPKGWLKYPAVYWTRLEAEQAIADAMVSYWSEVLDGDRRIEEVPSPDEVFEVDVYEDGAIVGEGCERDEAEFSPRDIIKLGGWTDYKAL
jgi:hypothetical protein